MQVSGPLALDTRWGSGGGKSSVITGCLLGGNVTGGPGSVDNILFCRGVGWKGRPPPRGTLGCTPGRPSKPIDLKRVPSQDGSFISLSASLWFAKFLPVFNNVKTCPNGWIGTPNLSANVIPELATLATFPSVPSP